MLGDRFVKTQSICITKSEAPRTSVGFYTTENGSDTVTSGPHPEDKMSITGGTCSGERECMGPLNIQWGGSVSGLSELPT